MKTVPMMDWSLQAVQDWDACPPGRECEHCKAGRPAAPEEAGHPFDREAVGPEIDGALRFALPPAFHLPRFMDLCTPKVWVCLACWDDDGNVHGWPCQVACAHGTYVDRVMRLAAQVRAA